MNTLGEDILQKRKEELLAEKRRVEERIAQLKSQDPFSDPGRVTDNAASDTEASEESDHDRVASIVSELTVQREAIRAALLRIGTGTYGKCLNCGNQIEESRLNILPTATLCLSCEKLKKHSRNSS